MHKSRHPLLPSIVVGVLLGIVVAAIFFHSSPSPTPAPEGAQEFVPEGVTPVVAVTDEPDLLEDERNTIEVYEASSPSVAFIINKSVRRDIFSLDVFEVPQGSGSGFVWDKQGHIVTNFHVIQNGNAWDVTLYDNTTYSAELIGYEASKDLAVIKIDAPRSKLKPVRMGSSESLRVGQKVIAIGNPFGLDQTLTTGVISALGREIKAVTGRTIQGVIQTDAAINPGNSGGPLLNSHGELIGVNTAIFSTSGSSAGIGFAVPVSTVRRVIPQLVEHGKVIKPGLGIFTVDDNIARRLGINGVIIARVQRHSSAARAGLRGITESRWGRVRLGDVIIGVNGKPVTNLDELSNELERYEVGEVVTLNLLRDDSETSVKVRLQELD